MDVKKVVVVGGGTMGNGIAHIFAQNGYETLLIDIKQEYIDSALGTIKKNLERQAQKGTIQLGDVAATLGRIRTSINLDDACTSDLVIEAIFENMDVKTEIFKKLDFICKPDTIWLPSTSSLPITAIAAQTKRADRVIGMHFMNPVPMMKLVELIRGIATSNETLPGYQ